MLGKFTVISNYLMGRGNQDMAKSKNISVENTGGKKKPKQFPFGISSLPITGMKQVCAGVNRRLCQENSDS